MKNKLYEILNENRKLLGGEITEIARGYAAEYPDNRTFTKGQIDNFNEAETQRKQVLEIEEEAQAEIDENNSKAINVFDRIEDVESDIAIKNKTKKSRLQKAETVGFVASGLVITNAAISAASPMIAVSTPVLAISGIGLPLAASLLLLAGVAQTLQRNLILNNLLTDCEMVMKKTIYMHELIITTLSIFNDVVNEIPFEDIVRTRQIDMIKVNKPKAKLKGFENFEKRKVFQEINFDPDFLEKLKLKLIYFNSKLTELVPNVNDSVFNKVSRGFKRTTSSSKYIEIVQRELTILNTYFIIYNNQFEWILRRYEKEFERKGNGQILKFVWKMIESTKEYKDYLDNPNLDEKIKEIEEDSQIYEKVKKEVKTAVEVKNIEKGEQNGGKKSRKNIQKSKKKTLKINASAVRKIRKNISYKKT